MLVSLNLGKAVKLGDWQNIKLIDLYIIVDNTDAMASDFCTVVGVGVTHWVPKWHVAAQQGMMVNSFYKYVLTFIPTWLIDHVHQS